MLSSATVSAGSSGRPDTKPSATSRRRGRSAIDLHASLLRRRGLCVEAPRDASGEARQAAGRDRVAEGGLPADVLYLPDLDVHGNTHLLMQDNNNDAILPGDTGNDDLIYGYGGNDRIDAGDGNDEVVIIRDDCKSLFV